LSEAPALVSEYVILVDEQGNQTGVQEKMAAHRAGQLHRAFSVYVFNSAGEWLLQKRAAGKYHSGGLWSNACCSHPNPGQSELDGARVRLGEEMGIQCDLTEVKRFLYRVELPNGLTEHEYDHVYLGRSDATPSPDPQEVEDWRWIPTDELADWLERRPGDFTHWFVQLFPDIRALAP
jgi:isopentenyl-diphosphate delta-isomerase